MKLLLTGASGFLGRNVLIGAPADWQIIALYSSDNTFPAFVSQLGRANVTAYRCDLRSPEAAAGLVCEHGVTWDACVHLAAKVDIPWSVGAPKDDLLDNVVPLLHLLDRIRADRFIYFSSGAVYDGLAGEVTPAAQVAPTLPYAITKLACERYVEFYQRRRGSIRRHLIVRFFGAYGPYEAQHKIYSRLIRAFALEGRRQYTIYGDGQNLIDAMFVDDAVHAIVMMLSGAHWNAIVDLSAGRPIIVEDLVRAVANALGVHGVRIAKEGTANENNRFWGSTRDMRQLYGFVPEVELADGVSRFRDFLLTQHDAA